MESPAAAEAGDGQISAAGFRGIIMKVNRKSIVMKIVCCFTALVPLFFYREKFLLLKMPGLASVKPYEPSLGGWQMIHTLFDKEYWIKILSMDKQILPRELDALGVTGLYNYYRLVVVVFVLLPLLFLLLAACFVFTPTPGPLGRHERTDNKRSVKVSGDRSLPVWPPLLSVGLLAACYGGLRFVVAPAANVEIRHMLQNVTDPLVAERFGRVLSIDFAFGPAYYSCLLAGIIMIILHFMKGKEVTGP